MKVLSATIALSGIALVLAGPLTEANRAPRASTPLGALAMVGMRGDPLAPGPRADRVSAATAEELTEVVQAYCTGCHNDRRLTGGLSLEAFEVAKAAEEARTAEKMIVKLRAGMMPPPGRRRPPPDTLLALVETLERTIDEAAADDPNPGTRTFQRLNRPEYERAIYDLLGLRIDAGDYLPLDTKSANFDNIADVQLLSPTLLGSYLSGAEEVSRIAVGNADVVAGTTHYSKSGYYSQWDRVPGAPFGSRGGMSVMHNFPADGQYVFEMAFDHTTTGGFFGTTARRETLEISIDGVPMATLVVDPFMNVSDPNGVNVESEPMAVTAGPHRVSAVFIKRAEGPVEDLTSPHEWSLTDRQIGASSYRVTMLPHVKDLSITGPFDVTGVSPTPSRQRIFSCRPATAADDLPCAREIIARLGGEAYRRPLDDGDVEDLLAFYREGAAVGGFEEGVRTALQAILASPDFIFRFEPPAEGVNPVAGEPYPISDLALASRLSFFLWGSTPDARLVELASEGELSDPDVLRAEALRMLEDSRSEALATRFASQWLRLQDLQKVHPDAFWYPDYDQQLADAMTRETQLFFYNLVEEDRSLLELFTADYTFVNERLATHYGFEGVIGRDFHRIEYPDGKRRGLLGHGSILTLTSHANRTSPVLRGKWVMEVLMGTPPPPPPPGVPDLEETEGVADGHQLTTRERMELHRAAPTCNSCHRFMDPIGLALDQFSVTGKWRIRENGVPLDTRGELYDGTPISSASELVDALMERPIPLVRTFTENLMAYALGRRVEYYDQPTVRAIARQAREHDYRMSEFILGVVESAAFRMKMAPAVAQDGEEARQHQN